MKKIFITLSVLFTFACAQDPYHLKISNGLNNAHGQSLYFRSNLRSTYSSQIRRVLSNKFGEMGIKTATSPENADYIAVFDIETFYKQENAFKNTSYANTNGEGVLFTDEEDATSLNYSGNANINVDHDKTCFTLNIGRKGTSNISYESSLCANEIIETEDILPIVLDVYSKHATYLAADVGVQCHNSVDGIIQCNTMYDRQQAFMNTLWIDSDIVD